MNIYIYIYAWQICLYTDPNIYLKFSNSVYACLSFYMLVYFSSMPMNTREGYWITYNWSYKQLENIQDRCLELNLDPLQ